MTPLSIVLLNIALMAGCSNVDEDYIPGPIMPPESDEQTGTTTPPSGDEPTIEHPEEGEMYNSYQGLVMCGYQGWFACPGDGSTYSKESAWPHYSQKWSFPRGFAPGPGKCGIDMWPDVREYEKTYEATPFTLPDGSHPHLFSSWDESSVNLHFKWMKDYGISGVFMQRFASQVGNPTAKELSDKVLESAMKASNEHGRAICMMYDLVGLGNECSVDELIADIRAITEKYKFFDREAADGHRYYLYHEGKPLMALVSVVESNVEDAQRITDVCQEMGFSMMISCPTYWRNGGGDWNAPRDVLHALIKDVDILTPWYVGRYDHDGTAGAHGGKFANFKEAVVKGDKEWLDKNGVEFSPLCFAGYSDRNMHPNSKVFKRAKGDFFWSQVYNSAKIGCKMIYVAMFDEIDEGTAIFKCLRQEEVPSNSPVVDYWVVYENGTYTARSLAVGPKEVTGNGWCKKASELGVTFTGIDNELQSDHYLWLAGQAGKMLRGEIPMTEKQPKRE